MEKPDFKKLRKRRAEHRPGEHLCSSYAQGVHSNPKFFKYYWWVFWNESPVDGDEFLTDSYRLRTADALQLMDRLEKAGEPYWVYNEKVPRLDPASTPFDPQSPHWEGVEWAPPYDDDPDP